MINTPRTMHGIAFSIASRDELGTARAFLSANGLPEEDIDAHIEHFLLA
jgi:hypothetical protein